MDTTNSIASSDGIHLVCDDKKRRKTSNDIHPEYSGDRNRSDINNGIRNSISQSSSLRRSERLIKANLHTPNRLGTKASSPSQILGKKTKDLTSPNQPKLAPLAQPKMLETKGSVPRLGLRKKANDPALPSQVKQGSVAQPERDPAPSLKKLGSIPGLFLRRKAKDPALPNKVKSASLAQPERDPTPSPKILDLGSIPGLVLRKKAKVAQPERDPAPSLKKLETIPGLVLRKKAKDPALPSVAYPERDPSKKLDLKGSIPGLVLRKKAKDQASLPNKVKSASLAQSERDPAPSSKAPDWKALTPRQELRKKDQASPHQQLKLAPPSQPEPPPSPSPSKVSMEDESPHITWSGFDETWEVVERSCDFCTGDLSEEQIENDGFGYYDDDEGDGEPQILPEVSILPCGHVYHSQCMQYFTAKEHSFEPSCFLCSFGQS